MARTVPQAVIALTADSLVTKFRGAYSSSVTYRVGEWVSQGGLLWACTADTNGNTPETGSGYWAAIGSLE